MEPVQPGSAGLVNENTDANVERISNKPPKTKDVAEEELKDSKEYVGSGRSS